MFRFPNNVTDAQRRHPPVPPKWSTPAVRSFRARTFGTLGGLASGQLQVHLASNPKQVVPALCLEMLCFLCLAHALLAPLAHGLTPYTVVYCWLVSSVFFECITCVYPENSSFRAAQTSAACSNNHARRSSELLLFASLKNASSEGSGFCCHRLDRCLTLRSNAHRSPHRLTTRRFQLTLQLFIHHLILLRT